MIVEDEFGLAVLGDLHRAVGDYLIDHRLEAQEERGSCDDAVNHVLGLVYHESLHLHDRFHGVRPLVPPMLHDVVLHSTQWLL